MPVRHSKFYIDDKRLLVTFLVGEQLFRVHRYMFEMESEVFRTMFEVPQGTGIVEGETDQSPIVLPSVSVSEMEALLKFFYFRQGLEEQGFSEDDWCNLLSISHRYDYKITMAKRFGVEEWLLPACMALVERKAPLTSFEAHKLGLTTTVLLGEAREEWIQRQKSDIFNSYNSYNQQPNKDSSQLVKKVLHIK